MERTSTHKPPLKNLLKAVVLLQSRKLNSEGSRGMQEKLVSRETAKHINKSKSNNNNNHEYWGNKTKWWYTT